MSALGIPQVAIVHGISVAGKIDPVYAEIFGRSRVYLKVVHMSRQWRMRISSSANKAEYFWLVHHL